VERLDAHIRSLDAAFQEAPEILKAVRVDAAPDVLDGVVNNFVHVGGIQIIVRRQGACVDGGTIDHMPSDQAIKGLFPTVRNYFASDFSAALQDAKDRNYIFSALFWGRNAGFQPALEPRRVGALCPN